MRRSLLFIGIFLLFSLFTIAQKADRFAYAITDVNKEGANWSFLRKIDLKTGNFGEVILNGTDATQLAYDDQTKNKVIAYYAGLMIP